MTDQPTQDAKVSQRAREAAAQSFEEDGVNSCAFLSDVRAGVLDGLGRGRAFHRFEAEIEAATIERCAGVLLEKADAFIGMSLHCRHRGPAETLRNKAQLLREQATVIRNLKGR